MSQPYLFLVLLTELFLELHRTILERQLLLVVLPCLLGLSFFSFFFFFKFYLKKIPLTLLKILVLKQSRCLPAAAGGEAVLAPPLGAAAPRALLGDAQLRSGCLWLCKH